MALHQQIENHSKLLSDLWETSEDSWDRIIKEMMRRPWLRNHIIQHLTGKLHDVTKSMLDVTKSMLDVTKSMHDVTKSVDVAKSMQ